MMGVRKPSDLGRTASKLADQDSLLSALCRAVSSMDSGCYRSTAFRVLIRTKGLSLTAVVLLIWVKPFGWIVGDLES